MEEHKKYATGEFMTPDANKKKRKGDLWCPYCGEWRKFKMGLPNSIAPETPSSWKRCVGCGIGIEDFWVKKVNGLFESYCYRGRKNRE